jgi:starch synthase
MPYLPENEESSLCRHLSQAMQEHGNEIRTFMPRYGCVNERRNQLHEVIRLSGMNLIINDDDHQLIIKVSSIPAARIQIYFIDNDDFFSRKAVLTNEEGKEFSDNDARMMFYACGVLETVKKLQWKPSVVHCHGWFSAIAPLYIRHTFSDDPLFANTKVVVSLYDDAFTSAYAQEFGDKMTQENPGIDNINLQNIGTSSYQNLMKLVMDYADGIVIESDNVASELKEYAKASGKPVLERAAFAEENDYLDAYQNFYNEL